MRDLKNDLQLYRIRRIQELEVQLAVMRKIIESVRDDLLVVPGSSEPETWVDDAREKLESVLSSDAGKKMLGYVKRLEAVAEAARELSKYDDFSQPSYCPKCGPINPGRYNVAREKFYEALTALDDVDKSR